MKILSQLIALFVFSLSVGGTGQAARAQQIAPGFETIAAENFDPPTSLTTLILRESLELWGLLDAGETEAAYARFAPDLQAVLIYPDWLEIQAGAAEFPAPRMIVRVSWYKDHPSAPRDGVLAAVDWVVQLGSEPVGAGYLLWQEAEPGHFMLLRTESNDFRPSTPTPP